MMSTVGGQARPRLLPAEKNLVTSFNVSLSVHTMKELASKLIVSPPSTKLPVWEEYANIILDKSNVLRRATGVGSWLVSMMVRSSATPTAKPSLPPAFWAWKNSSTIAP
jgi:hypothetical protein